MGWGGYKAPYYPLDEMKSFAAMAHNCVFMTADYRRTISPAGKGMVYCDPPYEPMPGTTGFTAYAAGGFNWENRWAGEAMRISLSPWGSGSDF